MKILRRRPVRESLFKAATLEPATLLIKRLWQRRFSGNFSWMLIKLTFIIWIAFISLPSSVFIVYLEDQYFYSKEYELPALNYSLIVTFSLWFFFIERFTVELNWNNILSVIKLFLPLHEKRRVGGKNMFTKISYFIKHWLKKSCGLETH